MSRLFKNKYRIETTRATWWDYAGNGAYFITINTKNRECFFGEIYDGKMNYSEIGQLADKYWLEIPDHFPGVKLDAHIVMPNHMHGILIIDKMDHDGGDGMVGDAGIVGDGGIVETPKLGVSTADPSRKPTDPPARHRTGSATKKWKPQTIGVIINQYKRKCTIDAWKINPVFAWQSRFHDHIIRNDQEFQRIRNYIINNPKNWETDALR